jgi:hypothetical protein
LSFRVEIRCNRAKLDRISGLNTGIDKLRINCEILLRYFVLFVRTALVYAALQSLLSGERLA